MKPGSPNCLVLFIISVNFSFGVDRNSNTLLLLRPRCGFSMYHAPVFAVIISLSSRLKIVIIADLRTPPAITASEACIIMSNTSIGLILVKPKRKQFSITNLIFSMARRSGSGPGALPFIKEI